MTKTTGEVAMEWMGRGACQGEDPELFFPREEGTRQERSEQIDKAKAVCTRCPVLHLCRQWALDTRQEFGVWGGLSHSEREEIRRGKRTYRAPHDETPDMQTVNQLVNGTIPTGYAARIDVAHAAVRLIDEGWTFRGAGRALGVDGATIRQWAHRAWAGEPLIDPAWLERQRRNAEQWMAEAS